MNLIMLHELLLDDLNDEQFDVLRDDESLCIRRNGDPVVYLQLEHNEEIDRLEASLNFAVGCSPAIAAFISLIINDHVYATVDLEFLFTATKVEAVEIAQ